MWMRRPFRKGGRGAQLFNVLKLTNKTNRVDKRQSCHQPFRLLGGRPGCTLLHLWCFLPLLLSVLPDPFPGSSPFVVVVVVVVVILVSYIGIPRTRQHEYE